MSDDKPDLVPYPWAQAAMADRDLVAAVLRQAMENIRNPPPPEVVAERRKAAADKRADERAGHERIDLTLDTLLGAVGWSDAYAEHLVQPYCYCSDGYDGWETCAHAYDEGVA